MSLVSTPFRFFETFTTFHSTAVTGQTKVVMALKQSQMLRFLGVQVSVEDELFLRIFCQALHHRLSFVRTIQ